MITPGVTVLQRSAFLPGESLRSLLGRLRELNLLTATGVDRLFFPGQPRPVATMAPWEPALLAHLSRVTGVAAAEIVNATPQRYRALLASPSSSRCHDMPICERSWYKSLPHSSHAWYCPTCLAETPYHHMLWDMAWSSCCLDHACYLHDRCAACGCFTTITAILHNQCEGCHHPLTNAAPMPCPSQTAGFQVQWLLTHWMEHPDTTRQTMAWQLPGWEVRTLLVVLRGVVTHLQQVDPLRVGISPTSASAKNAHWWLEAMRTLSHWPHGVDRFVDRWCLPPSTYRYTFEDFTPIYPSTEALVQAYPAAHPFFAALEASLLRLTRIRHMLVDGYLAESPAFVIRYQEAHQRAMAAYFSVTETTVTGFQALGILPQQLPLVDRNEYDPLLHHPFLQWRFRPADEHFAAQLASGGVTMAQMAQWLNLSAALVAAWMQLPLTPEQQFTSADIKGILHPLCERCLCAVAAKPLKATEWVSFAEAASLLRWHGLAFAEWCRETIIFGLCREDTACTFDLATYRISRRLVLHAITTACLHRLGVAANDLATYLRVMPSVSQALLRISPLSQTITVRNPQQRWQVIPYAVIQQFEQAMLFGRTIVRQWRISEPGLRRLPQHYGITPVWQSADVAPRYWVYQRQAIEALAQAGSLVPRSMREGV